MEQSSLCHITNIAQDWSFFFSGFIINDLVSSVKGQRWDQEKKKTNVSTVVSPKFSPVCLQSSFMSMCENSLYLHIKILKTFSSCKTETSLLRCFCPLTAFLKDLGKNKDVLISCQEVGMFEILSHSNAVVLAPEFRCDQDVSVCRGMEGQLLGRVRLNLNSYNTQHRERVKTISQHFKEIYTTIYKNSTRSKVSQNYILANICFLRTDVFILWFSWIN